MLDSVQSEIGLGGSKIGRNPTLDADIYIYNIANHFFPVDDCN